MTTTNAKKFIIKGQEDTDLRRALNGADTIEELYQLMADRNLSFTESEFEEAYNEQLVNCQHHDFAEQLQEFKMWWEMLHKILGSPSLTGGSACESSQQCGNNKSCGSCCG